MAADPYKVLGLERSATADQIKKAYRRLVRTSHPDLNPDDSGAEARFKEVSAAYELLSDPETRARFDRGEIDALGAETRQRTYYRDFAGAAGNPYQPRGFEGFDDPSDVFAEFLRGGRRGQHEWHETSFSTRGTDLRYSLEVPFLDAVRGTTTRVTLPDGAALDVRIPEGTADGQTLRLRGKGRSGTGGGSAGDALVTVSVLPHPHFHREGDDILLTLPITLDEAVLGGKVAAPTIGGTVNLTVPKGASSGQVLRLRGRGVRRGERTGDQLVELRVVSPPQVDEELAEFMRNWRHQHSYDPRTGMS